MSEHQHGSVFDAERTTHQWLRAVADQLRTSDLRYAHRLLRAWLHTMRDALRSHIPLCWPLSYPSHYDGWEPARTPVRHDIDDYVGHFAQAARISTFEVLHGAPTVSTALRAYR